jgi:hypothetical protein
VHRAALFCFHLWAITGKMGYVLRNFITSH